MCSVGRQDTYSILLDSVFGDLDKAIGSYRYTVHSTIPKAVRVAWVLKKDEIQKATPGITRKKFLYNMSKASYRKQWGKDYESPGRECSRVLLPRCRRSVR